MMKNCTPIKRGIYIGLCSLGLAIGYDVMPTPAQIPTQIEAKMPKQPSLATIPDTVNQLFTYYAYDRPHQTYPFLTKDSGEELFTSSFLNLLYHHPSHPINGLAGLTKDPICDCTNIGQKGLDIQSMGVLSSDNDKGQVIVTYNILENHSNQSRTVELHLVKENNKWLIDNIIRTIPFNVREHIQHNGNL